MGKNMGRGLSARRLSIPLEPLEARTLLAASIVKAGVQPRDLTVVGGSLYFSGYDTSAGRELWSSDGTSDGTQRVVDLLPGSRPIAKVPTPSRPFPPGNFRDVDGSLFFAGVDAEGYGFFKSGGSAKTTVKLAKSPQPTYVFGVGAIAYFEDGTDLWRSDGTPAGTQRLTGGKGLRFGRIIQVTALGQNVYTLATDRADSKTVYLLKTDGSTGATSSLRRFTLSGNRYAVDLDVFGKELFFQAPDDSGGESLWQSDGTAKGTVPVASIASSDSDVVAYGPFTNQGLMYFFTSDPNAGEALWVSDGTAKGTSQLARISTDPLTTDTLPHFESIGSEFFFSATAKNGDAVIWASDGTAKGTEIMKEFDRADVESFFSYWTAHNHIIYFGTNDYGDTTSVFAFDGKHTKRIATTTDKGSIYGPELTFFDNKVFFATSENLWEASLLPPGSVRGAVFRDDNKNGVQDKKEAALMDFNAWLDLNDNGKQDQTDPTSHTDALGRISFNVDVAGTYPLYVTPHGGFKSTVPLPLAVTLSPWTVAHVAIGEFKFGMIIGNVYDSTLDQLKPHQLSLPLPGARVFLDQNGNSRFDAGEPFTRSDANGYFEFDHLKSGHYVVCQTPLGAPWSPPTSHWAHSTVIGSTKYLTDTPGGQSIEVPVTAGGLATVEFFQTQKAYPVAVQAFIDSNKNGLFDVGEAAASGLEISFGKMVNGFLDLNELPYVTDAKGRFGSKLVPGTFVFDGYTGTVNTLLVHADPVTVQIPQQGTVLIPYVKS